MRRPQRLLLHFGIQPDRYRSPFFLPLLLLLLLLVVVVASFLRWVPPPSQPSRPLPAVPRLAYLLSGTAGDSPRLSRLLRVAYHPRNYYLLHLDLAAPSEERSELARDARSEAVFSEVGNVWVSEKPNRITDKGPTEVASTLHAVALLLRHANDWDWFLNLHASDYPLMPQDDILHIFSYLPRGLNFIQHTTEIGWKESQRVRPIIVDPGLYGVKKSSVFWAKEKRALPSAFKLFVGSPQVVLTRSFLKFCIWGWDNLPRTLLMYYTNYLQSSEGYFHSVICNSKDFQNTTVNHDLRFVKWDTPPRQQPAVIAEKDFDLMVNSGAPFAHNLPKDGVLVGRIDKELLGRSNGQFITGSWCLGGSPGGKGACTIRGNHANIRPTARSRRLEKLLLEVLYPQTFRSKQCT